MIEKQKVKAHDLINLLYTDNFWTHTENKYKCEAVLSRFGETYFFSVDLYDIWTRTTDCKIGHWGANFWFRTSNGLKAKKYKSLKRFETGIKKAAIKNGFEFERFKYTCETKREPWGIELEPIY